jgi:MoxR-like ATPase
VEKVYAAKELRVYVSAIAAATRRSGALQLGVSTRGAISLLRAAQAFALLDGRDFVKPDDVQRMAEPVLAHRLVLSPEARMRNMTAQRVLNNVMGNVQVPVKSK